MPSNDTQEPMVPDSGFDARKGKRRLAPLPFAAPDEKDDPVIKRDPLDAEDMVDRHGRLMDMYRSELDRQADNREAQAVDEDFYDSIQWDEEDAEILRERGQMPMVYNILATSVNWVLGSERRSRTDFKVLPRRKGESRPAERKTALMKYLSDVNMTPFQRSRAFADAVKVGVGWIEDGFSNDAGADLISTHYVSWRDILWDSASTDLTLKDARYVFRTKWVDLDYAIAMFPRRAGLLRAAVGITDSGVGALDGDGDDAMDSREEAYQDAGFGGNETPRERVRLIEVWFRQPVQVDQIASGEFRGDVVVDGDQLQREMIDSGSVQVRSQVMARMHVAIMTSEGLLWYSQSPYRHNEFPFTPVWGYRRGRDNMPYGMIRGLRDAQSDVNKRASKALAILSSNKVLLEEGSVEDIDDFAEEVAKPNAILRYKKGYQPPKIDADRDLAAGHISLMQQSISMIQQASGVTDELLGRKTNATSGIAIQRRQDQGTLATSAFFDNLRLANQTSGAKELSLIEQFYTEQKEFRITNMRGTPSYVTLNDGLPENDIIRTKADFVLSETDWNSTIRQAQLAELLDVVAKLAPVAPQAVLVMLDLVVDSMDIPSREEIVARIRQMTGMSDPDSEEQTPQQAQEQQAREAAKAAQAQLQQAMALANLTLLQAKAAKEKADADLSQLRAGNEHAKTVLANTAAQNQAAQAAQVVTASPDIAGVADTLLTEAGFVTQTQAESQQAMEARAMEAQAQQAQQAQDQPPGGPAMPRGGPPQGA